MATCCVQRRRRYVHFVSLHLKLLRVLTTCLPPPRPCALYLWEVSGCTGAPVLSWRFGFRRFRWFGAPDCGAAWRAASCGCARDRVHFKYIVSAYESRISTRQSQYSRPTSTTTQGFTSPGPILRHPPLCTPSFPSSSPPPSGAAPPTAPLAEHPTGQVPRQCRAGGGEEGANQA